MNLYEYHGKRLLAEAGILIPPGEIATTPEQAEEVAARLGGERWMIKAQVLSSGRARGSFVNTDWSQDLNLAGGVHQVNNHLEVHPYVNAMLGNTLKTVQTGEEGAVVERVYLEKVLDFERELSMAMLVDAKLGKVVLLYSNHGGSDIESVAAQVPESIYKLVIEDDAGATQAQLETLAGNLNLTDKLADQAKQIVHKIHSLFIGRDASLIEINPLAVADGELIALDAKIVLDDNAMFRQLGNRYLAQDEYRPDDRLQASKHGFNYFRMDGNIGCLAVGAGLSMATIDAIKYLDGKSANFLDLPPDSKIARSRSAIEQILGNPSADCLLINVFGGGIMRCDTIADALLLINRSTPIRIPVVVRFSGTNADLARRRLKESMPQVFLAENMAQAAQKAVDIAAAAGLKNKRLQQTKGIFLARRLKMLLTGNKYG